MRAQLAALLLATMVSTSSHAASEKLKIAVMDLRATNLGPGIGETLTSILSEELDVLGAFAPISKEDVSRLLELERLKDSIGCNDVACLAELGGALGAELMVAGSVTRLEDVYLIQLQLIRITQARVEGRVSREFKGDALGLTRDLRAATRLLVRDLLAARSGDLAVRASEEGASVKVDGALVGVTPLAGPLPLAEGLHTLAVDKEGFILFTRDVTVVKDELTEVAAALQPSPAFLAAYEADVRTWRIARYTLFGTGAAAAVASVLAYLKGAEEASAYQEAYDRDRFASGLESHYREIGRLDAIALGAGLIAIGALGSGAATLLFGPEPDRYGAR